MRNGMQNDILIVQTCEKRNPGSFAENGEQGI